MIPVPTRKVNSVKETFHRVAAAPEKSDVLKHTYQYQAEEMSSALALNILSPDRYLLPHLLDPGTLQCRPQTLPSLSATPQTLTAFLSLGLSRVLP